MVVLGEDTLEAGDEVLGLGVLGTVVAVAEVGDSEREWSIVDLNDCE